MAQKLVHLLPLIMGLILLILLQKTTNSTRQSEDLEEKSKNLSYFVDSSNDGVINMLSEVANISNQSDDVSLNQQISVKGEETTKLLYRIQQLENKLSTLEAYRIHENRYQLSYDAVDNMSLLDIWIENLKSSVLSSIPKTDHSCSYNLTSFQCEPKCECDLQWKWGDYNLDRACRKRHRLLDSCSTDANIGQSTTSPIYHGISIYAQSFNLVQASSNSFQNITSYIIWEINRRKDFSPLVKKLKLYLSQLSVFAKRFIRTHWEKNHVHFEVLRQKGMKTWGKLKNRFLTSFFQAWHKLNSRLEEFGPESDDICLWDFQSFTCIPPKYCKFSFQWGDLTLNKACRLRIDEEN